MTKTNLTMVIAAIAIAGFSPAALAGFTQPAEVDIIPNVAPDPAGGLAQGDMTTARYNADKDVFIGCGIRKILTGGGTVVSTGFARGGMRRTTRSPASPRTPSSLMQYRQAETLAS